MTLGEAGPAKRERAALVERNGEKCGGDSAMLNLESPEECWDSASIVTCEMSCDSPPILPCEIACHGGRSDSEAAGDQRAVGEGSASLRRSTRKTAGSGLASRAARSTTR